MRKIVVSEFVTLDGVMEDPGGAEGFKYGGWTLQLSSTEQQQFTFEELFKADTLLLGRRTYQGLLPLLVLGGCDFHTSRTV
jgi:dihydrofolate reductase